MNVIITAGGTRCPIDSVRYIGNNSKGKTGALLADYFTAKGDKVVYIHGKDAHQPKAVHRSIEINTPEEYKNTLIEMCVNADIAILSMAVSDYAPIPQPGKIKSDKTSLSIELIQTPKVIAELRKTYPKLFIVGFKLLTEDASQVALIRAGYEMMLNNKLNMAVLNRVSHQFKVLNTGILTPEKNYQPVIREDLPKTLYNRIQQRLSTTYFNTLHTSPKRTKPPAVLLDALKKLNALSLFPKYQPEKPNSPSFGFVAYKQEQNIWITGRGSRKDTDTFVNLEAIKGTTIVVRGKTKATLNSYVATALFDKFPNRKFCIHFHHILQDRHIIKLKETTPGTLQDYTSVKAALQKASTNSIGIYQKYHGTTLCLNSIEELEYLLLQNNCYNKTAQHYDRSYQRFNNDSLLTATVNATPPTATVWDVAGGTGNLSAQLLAKGFANITIIDQSQPMLIQARHKLGQKVKIKNCSMQDIGSLNNEPLGTPMRTKKPNTICIRQAINYLSPQEIRTMLQQMLKLLASKGQIFINTFVTPNLADKNTETNSFEVSEKNSKAKAVITHGQYVTDWNTGETYYDLNRFFDISTQDWKNILRNMQYKWIKKERSVLIIINKST